MPSAAHFHNNLGGVYRRMGKMEEAAACWRKAVAIDPNLAEAHNSLGNVARMNGQPNEAIECYRKAIAIAPNNPLAHNNLGVMLQEVGEYAQAAESAGKAIALGVGAGLGSIGAGIGIGFIFGKEIECASLRLPDIQNRWQKRKILSYYLFCPLCYLHCGYLENVGSNLKSHIWFAQYDIQGFRIEYLKSGGLAWKSVDFDLFAYLYYYVAGHRLGDIDLLCRCKRSAS
jgi:tetratricopeptide (TPR) repeat protein